MFLIVAAIGWFLRFTIGSPIWLALEIYAYILVAFQLWHWAAHQRILFFGLLPNPMYRVHLYHHWHVYPPTRFLSTLYKDDKAGRTTVGSLAHDGPLYALMVLNIALLKYYELINWYDVVASVGVVGFVGSYSNWMHHAIHIEGHWIERFVYFHDLRALHYTHHQGTALHNFGIIDFGTDYLGAALYKPDYSLSNGPAKKDAASASAPGKGSEHRSKCKPGPPPTMADGLQEVSFYYLSSLIEVLVVAIGSVFGGTKDKKGRPASSGTAPAGSDAGKPKDDVLVSWADFFLFN